MEELGGIARTLEGRAEDGGWERFGGRTQHLHDLIGSEVRDRRQHQRDHAADLGRRHARALVAAVDPSRFREVGIDHARVQGRKDLLVRICDLIAAGRRDVDHRSEVRVVRPVAEAGRGSDRDHVVAVGRCRCLRRIVEVTQLVSSGDDDDGTSCDGGIDGGLLDCRAQARAAEAEVDDLCRCGVDRLAGHQEPGGPPDRVRHVRRHPAARPEDPDGLDACLLIDAGHPDGVARLGADDPGHVEAVPRARVAAARRSLVERIGIAPVAIAGAVRIADHVVTRDQAAVDVGMGEDPGVDHGDHDRRRTGRDVPRLLDVDAVCRRAVVGRREVPLLGVERVVRRCRGVARVVGLGRVRQPFGDELLRDRFGLFDRDRFVEGDQPEPVCQGRPGLGRHAGQRDAAPTGGVGRLACRGVNDDTGDGRDSWPVGCLAVVVTRRRVEARRRADRSGGDRRQRDRARREPTEDMDPHRPPAHLFLSYRVR